MLVQKRGGEEKERRNYIKEDNLSNKNTRELTLEQHQKKSGETEFKSNVL